MMNVHHLELFYYVARHGGVSAAAREMPYGIQQPAISAQILQLEDSLGVTLFTRRPFQLTKEGQSLYEFIAPFFGGLDAMEEKLRGGGETRLRIAAPEIVQREYLPELFVRMRKRVPRFHFTMSLPSVRWDDIHTSVRREELDILLGILTHKTSPPVQSRELVSLPLVLLVAKQSGISRAEEVLERDRIDVPLITLPKYQGVSLAFQSALQKRSVDWPPSLELDSLDLVARYVAEGFGIGLSLHLPQFKLPSGVKEIPLPDFPPVTFAAMWSGNLSPLGEAFIEEAGGLAKELLGG